MTGHRAGWPGRVDHLSRYAWVPLAVLAVGMVVGVVFRPPGGGDPPWLLPPLNTVFLTLVPILVAYLAARAYRATGVPVALAIGAGMLAIAVGSGAASAILLFTDGANQAVTLHNCGVLLAAAAQATGVVTALAQLTPTDDKHRHRHVWAVYGVVALTLTGVLTAILTGAMPTFFTADGPTILRQVVLGLAIELFAFATLYWWLTFRSTRLAMLRWYYLGMAIFTVGLVGVFAEETVGDLISWTGRAGQFLAAPYFLIAVLLSGRPGEAGSTEPTVGVTLAHSALTYRPLVESATESIVAIDARRRILYWNEASRRLFGHTPDDTFGRDLIDILAPDPCPPASRATLAGRLSAGDPGGRAGPVQVELLRGDGRPFPAEVAVFADRANPRAKVCVIHDISERIHAEHALEQANQALERANQSLEQAVTDRTAQLSQALQLLQEQTKASQRYAREVNDSIVQGLVAAEISADLGHTEESRQLLAATSLAARRWIGEQLVSAGELQPGALVRTQPNPRMDPQDLSAQS